MSSKQETIGAGHRGLLMAIIANAADMYLHPHGTTLRAIGSPERNKEEGRKFFTSDPLYEAICFHLDVDPEAVRERLGLCSDQSAS